MKADEIIKKVAELRISHINNQNSEPNTVVLDRKYLLVLLNNFNSKVDKTIELTEDMEHKLMGMDVIIGKGIGVGKIIKDNTIKE